MISTHAADVDNGPTHYDGSFSSRLIHPSKWGHFDRMSTKPIFYPVFSLPRFFLRFFAVQAKNNVVTAAAKMAAITSPATGLGSEF